MWWGQEVLCQLLVVPTTPWLPLEAFALLIQLFDLLRKGLPAANNFADVCEGHLGREKGRQAMPLGLHDKNQRFFSQVFGLKQQLRDGIT